MLNSVCFVVWSSGKRLVCEQMCFLLALKVVVLGFNECLFSQKLPVTFWGVNSDTSIPCKHLNGILCYDVMRLKQ